MAYRGHSENGEVGLDESIDLPDGTTVSVKVMTLCERLLPFIGRAEGLPSHLAENHDHYLHGHPR